MSNDMIKKTRLVGAAGRDRRAREHHRRPSSPRSLYRRIYDEDPPE